MKKLTSLLTVVILSIVVVMPADSQDTVTKVAQTGFQFLKIDVGARAAAMGGAYMMVGQDASAMFYNPAGIAKIQNSFDVFASRTEWIADINYHAAGLVKNLGNWGHVGISFITADYGDVLGTRVAATEKGFEDTGNLDVGAFAVGVTYARAFTNLLTIGGQIRFTGQQLGESLLSNGETVKNDVDGLAYDLGTMFYPGFRSFRLGISVRNFSTDFKHQQESFQLPLTFTIGVAMDVLQLMKEGEHNNSLLLSVEGVHPRDFSERIHIGVEYLFADLIALRGGYKFNYDEEGVSAGVGLNYSGFRFDYAYSDLGLFDSVNRFAVGFSF